MQKDTILMLAAGCFCAIATQPANAAGPARAAMTCKEFLSYDEVTRPKVIYWAQGVKHKGRPQDAIIDVAETDRLIPILTEECQKAPRASFWSRLDASWMRAEGDIKRHL